MRRRTGGHAGLCALCGGPQRRRSARKSEPVADCGLCMEPVCERHVRWDTDSNRNVCTRCAREFGLTVTKG